MPNTFFGQTNTTIKSSLGREPYYSRFTQFENEDKNYILVGFTPGAALQAAELNEIQDNFQKNLTLSNYMFSYWVPYVTNYLKNNTSDMDSVLWNGAVPLDPAMITVISGGIRFGRGWYYYTHNSGLCYWVHLTSNYDVFVTTDQLSAGGFIGLTIDSSDISAFDDDTLFDNSGGFINTASPGAYRISNEIISFSYTTNQSAIKPILQIQNSQYLWMNTIPLTGA